MDETLQMGDHIFSWRAKGSYAHHGIYVGEEHGVKYVIHFTSTVLKGSSTVLKGSSTVFEGPEMAACEVCGYRANARLGVVKTCLYCFLSGDLLQVKDYHGCSNPPDKVVKTAFHLLNYGFGEYNLVTNNCEHFATFCKTGRPSSEQVVDAGKKADKVAQVTFRVGAIYSGVMAAGAAILLALAGSNSRKRN